MYIIICTLLYVHYYMYMIICIYIYNYIHFHLFHIHCLSLFFCPLTTVHPSAFSPLVTAFGASQICAASSSGPAVARPSTSAAWPRAAWWTSWVR